MRPAIRVVDLWKEYVLGGPTHHHDTFYDLLTGVLKAPFRRLRSLRGGTAAMELERFWALRELDFSIEPGEVVGIIGRNGAGKSTLLKVLSRITEPSRGRVEVRGRVASLLEVGTGFHPELTGRENIFLNGAILGMTRAEIRERFDEIVAFAEVDKFLDTPIKRYSSGMYVRLAFSVAAHLEPDVLVVDEVLAVGDAQFQRKSLGKMEDVARLGRTVLLVSHNLGAIRNLCRSVLLLEHGKLHYQGPTDTGLEAYEAGLSSGPDGLDRSHFRGALSSQLEFESLLFRQSGASVVVIDPTRELEIEVRGRVARFYPSFDLSLALFRDGLHVATCHDAPRGAPILEGEFVSRFLIPAERLKPGRYSIGLGAAGAVGEWTWGSDVGALEVSENWGTDSAARDKGAINLGYTAERTQP